MSKKGWAIGVVAFLAIVGSCSDKETTSTTTPAPVAAPTSSSPYVAPVAAPTTSAAPAGVAVTRVIDGDTFEIAGGQRVRVLGIDSCEIGTYGGTQAKQSAEIALDGESVVLEQEPGVDRDRYGRLLRYVSTGYGSDFGESMVGAIPHRRRPGRQRRLRRAAGRAARAGLRRSRLLGAGLLALHHGVRRRRGCRRRRQPPRRGPHRRLLRPQVVVLTGRTLGHADE